MRADRTGDGWIHRKTYRALDGIDFDVRPGEVVGIIGRNGAGKSTLLKILSRVTDPTRGRVELRGRVSSLLEVGTGFHSELSGRENIYLNGAILGMTRREIDRKFGEITAFAEIGDFLDTPVKRYSSGMYVRLAFAVAAHLEPEVLIVDEVLAVGDIAFQQKCLGRLRDVSRSGLTVLFVSHNMAAIESLCGRAILLDRGRIAKDGAVAEVIREYQRQIRRDDAPLRSSLWERDSPGREVKFFRSAGLLNENGEATNYIPLGGEFRLRIDFDAPFEVVDPTIGIGIDDSLGQRILTVHTPIKDPAIGAIAGRCGVECLIPHFPLAPGDYWLKLALTVKTRQTDMIEQAIQFSVADGDAFGEGRGFHRGLCVARPEWRPVPGKSGLKGSIES